jgi:molecular chaperone DnaK
MVVAELGRAEFRLDPVTVVAAGAALFASTQRLPAATARLTGQKEVQVKLAYSPNSADLDADVAIALDPAIPGSTLTVAREDGGWSSGTIAVPASGKLQATVVLRPKRSNVFDISLRNAAGQPLRISEGSFAITNGLVVVQATTSRGFGVALVDNEAQTIIPKGTPLPAKGTQRFLSAHEVVAGDPRSVLRVYVLQGEEARSDRNFQIGLMELRGDELGRSLPGGETVEITYKLDESSNLSAEAVFPSLREARTMRRDNQRPALSADEIDAELQKEKKRLAEVQRAAPEKVSSQIGRDILVVERESVAAPDDIDARQKATQKLIELKKAVDALEQSSEWELLLAELASYGESTRSLAREHGSSDQQKSVEKEMQTADQSVADHDLGSLRATVESLRDLYWEIAFAQDEFWKTQFAQLREETEFVDPLKAERLKEEGMRASKRSDISSLQTIVWDLYRLLPSWQKSKLDQQFRDAGLRKSRSQGA